ncbi:MAG: hypothetical protein K0R02_942 [Rickettsiaceae bacterium]|jgi:hypothetical protein|nr:hypothetical protein [Rickettsiaceae bacterium]
MTNYNNIIEYFEATGQFKKASDLTEWNSLNIDYSLLRSFSTEQLITLCKNTPGVSKIYLTLATPSEEEVTKFSNLLKDLKNIKSFTFCLTGNAGTDITSIFEALNNWNDLRGLRLDVSNLTNESANSLKDLIKNSKTIEDLSFYRSVNYYTMEKIAEALEQNISLDTIFCLNLNPSPLFQKAFTKALSKNPYITAVITDFAQESIKEIIDRNKAYIENIDQSIVKAAKYFTGNEEFYPNAKDIILLLEKEKNYITNKLLHNSEWNKIIFEKMSEEDQENSGLKAFIENLPQNVETFFNKLDNYKADNFLWLKCVSKSAHATGEGVENIDNVLEKYRDDNSNKEELKEFHLFPYLTLELQAKIFKLCNLSPELNIAGQQSDIASEQE